MERVCSETACELGYEDPRDEQLLPLSPSTAGLFDRLLKTNDSSGECQWISGQIVFVCKNVPDQVSIYMYLRLCCTVSLGR